ncbi:MAG: hypothetical protein RIQ52_985, partial [Pseudomonadota bacterium]
MLRPLLVLLGLWVTQEAPAEIFKFVDAAGRVTYTDRPRHAGFR